MLFQRVVGLKTRIFFSILLMGCFTSPSLAMYSNRYDTWRSWGGFDRRGLRTEELRRLNDCIKEGQTKIDSYVHAQEAHRSRAQIEQDKEYQRLADELAPFLAERQRYSNLTNQNKIGAAIARGLAGPDGWQALEDIQIDNAMDGFWHGVTMRTSLALGDLVGDKVKRTVDRVLGSAWDATLDKIIEYAHDANSLLFHGSKDAFTPEELKNWSDVIESCLKGFGALIKGRVEFESRSKDMNSRAFDSDDQTVVNQDQIIGENLLKHYAAQCGYYAQEIDSRKDYYKKEPEIIFIAEQLRDWLLEFKAIILSIKSLKEVSAKFGSNITMITETSTNIKKLFEKLILVITPPNSNLSDRTTKRSPAYTDSTTRRDYGRYSGGDSEFPLAYNGFSDPYGA